ncbi:MAG: hypothetical protein LC772_02105 [Chloroflexi bacterium]|nr:hypothetical protein [Chloroflexota bacterium]
MPAVDWLRSIMRRVGGRVSSFQITPVIRTAQFFGLARFFGRARFFGMLQRHVYRISVCLIVSVKEGVSVRSDPVRSWPEEDRRIPKGVPLLDTCDL